MKKMNLRILVSMIAVSMLFIACTPEEVIDSPAIRVNVSEGGVLLQGVYTSDIVLSANLEYILSGGVHFKDGTTLSIPAGTVIKSDSTVTSSPYSYLMIEQGATISALGEKENPIVFTSGRSNPNPGDWGGVIINGYAPINKTAPADTEIPGAVYGGSNAADNSGILKYVIVEFGGAKIDPETEHNGFTFNGVGNGTTIDYIQAINGTDDGIECFGGTVNMKHVICWGNTDDGFDWTYGYAGKVQYLLIQTGDGGDRGIEGDNNSGDHTASRNSYPTISNATVIGSGMLNEDGKAPEGVELRRGTMGDFSNFLISNFANSSIRVSDSITNVNINLGDLSFLNSTLSTGIQYKYENVIEAGNKFEELASVDVNEMISVITNNQSVGTLSGGKDMSSDSFFDVASYRGAVVTQDDWTEGWSR